MVELKSRPRVWLGVATVLVAGCAHRREPEPPLLPRSAGTASPSVAVAPVSYTLPLLQPPDINVDWLEVDDFVIPGATVLHRTQMAYKLYVTPTSRYPSTEECIAIDGDAVVGLLSEKTAPRMNHRLLLYKRGDVASTTVFTTPNAFEVSWSAGGQYVIITEYIGSNSSVLSVVRRDDGTAVRIDLRSVLEEYFSDYIIEAPQFQKAYRWSDGSKAVVRGLGRTPFPPFEIFGYELLVDVTRLGQAQSITMLRAFSKRVDATSDQPNKAPEPTPTAGTPRAMEMKSK